MAAMYARGAGIRGRRLVMYRAVDKTTGATIDLGNARFETVCPDCGQWHQIDLLDLVSADRYFDFQDTKVCCSACSDKQRKAVDHMDLFDYD